jgi:hypothetical protein
MSKLYRQVELTDEEHDDFVFPHQMAMTGEKLHSKAEIATELGVRDKRIAELEDKWVSGDEIPDKPKQYYLVAIRSPNKFGLIYEVAYLGAKFEWYKNRNGDIELWMPIPKVRSGDV